MKNTKHLRIYFLNGISGADWYTINNLYQNETKKPLNFLLVEMMDTLYKTVQLTDSLTKNQLIFLVGIIEGFTRYGMKSYEMIDNTGYKSSYNVQYDL